MNILKKAGADQTTKMLSASLSRGFPRKPSAFTWSCRNFFPGFLRMVGVGRLQVLLCGNPGKNFHFFPRFSQKDSLQNTPIPVVRTQGIPEANPGKRTWFAREAPRRRCRQHLRSLVCTCLFEYFTNFYFLSHTRSASRSARSRLRASMRTRPKQFLPRCFAPRDAKYSLTPMPLVRLCRTAR